MFTVRAPGKMILLGEYAVLEGAPALVSAVDRFAEVKLEESTGDSFLLSSAGLKLDKAEFTPDSDGNPVFGKNLDPVLLDKLKLFKIIFKSIYAGHSDKMPPLKMNLDTGQFYSNELNAKYGFGSSAALTVALVGGLLKAVKDDRTDIPEEIYRISLKAHRTAQGQLGSGIDIAASSFGGVLKYMMPGSGKANMLHDKLSLPEQLQMLVVWTGKSASTENMVRNVSELKNNEPQHFKNIMDQLCSISESGCQAFATGATDQFLDQIEAFYQAQIRFGKTAGVPIISGEHLSMHNFAELNKVYYKPSGAGGGDIGIFFTDDASKFIALRKMLLEKKITLLDVSTSQHGVSFDYN